jgi:hypothetical protein
MIAGAVMLPMRPKALDILVAVLRTQVRQRNPVQAIQQTHRFSPPRGSAVFHTSVDLGRS